MRGGPAGRAAAAVALVAVLAAAGLALFRRRELDIAGAVGWGAFPLDDAWIHLHFARNLGEGHGFSYNPGAPVAGSTAPLWTLALAAAFRAGAAEPAWAKVLGVAGAVAAAWGARQLAVAWTGRPALGLCAGALTALAGPLLWGALSGMEVTLAAALVAWALALHARAGGPRREALPAALVGLAALARPEAVLLAPLLWLAGPLTLRRAVAIGAPVAACLAPWVAFNLATAGSPLPATASAKVAGGLVGWLRGVPEPAATALLRRPWRFATEWARWLYAVNPLLPAAAAIGLGVLWRRRGAARAVPALVLLLHPVAMALLVPYQGPAFQEGRYSIHLLPLACALAAVALWPLVPRGARPAGPAPARPPGGWRAGWRPRARPAVRVPRWARPVAAGALGAALVAAGAWAVPAAAERYAWGVQNIEAMQVGIGRWIAGTTPPGARLALNDVGAIAYVSRREVVDVMGLVTPSIIPARRAGEAGVLAYLERACPDYLIVFPAWFPRITAMADRFAAVHRVRLARNAVAGADEMVVYTTPWTGRRASHPGCDPAVGRR